MWERTKRLINSYLDDLIDRSSRPDREVREITRGEIARLNELEVQARAAAKLLEKELAEVELKISGAAERERLMRESGSSPAGSGTSSDLIALAAHRDLLVQQIREANASAVRARDLRETRKRSGEELANETYLTSMREDVAGIQSPFSSTDPAATIDEMRSRINRAGFSTTDSRLAEAERELEVERARSKVDELLAQYKDVVSTGGHDERQAAPPPSAVEAKPPDAGRGNEAKEPEEPKTLGRSDGPIRPID